jgi:asparagine synthase (glutamine-hydrolysing)
MANFIAVVDADGERRRRFVRQVRSDIAPVDSLRLGEVEAGDFIAVWAALDRAPVSSVCSSTAGAIIWGDAIPGPGPERLDATGLLRAWAPHASEAPAAFDGFHAAVCYDEREGLTAGADVLGLFPVYYAACGPALIVGSSAELFRHHPCFMPELSLTGLTGILLSHAILDGQGLLSGVRRLRPGHLLRWRSGAQPREVVQYTIPVSSPVRGRSFRDDVDQLDAAFSEAIDRHIPPNGSIGILLSGGRDSRQLAGHVHERGHRLQALTLGAESDYDVRCATAVARTLGCPHRVANIDETTFTTGAIRQARWEHLASGFSSIHTWGAIVPLRELPARVLTGYLREIRECEPARFVYDQVLRISWTRRGIDAPVVRRLLRADVFDDVLDRVAQKMRAAYEAGCTDEEQRPWRFSVAHEWRSHAGGIPWRLSFGSWPILPILDRRVLETISTLSQSSLADRRAQDDILRRRFPELARLPLDRKSDDTRPILPSVGQRILHRIWRAIEPVRRRVPRRIERRYYHRIYDINGPGWRAVRQLAEPHRERLSPFFHMDVLVELVPPPDVRIEVGGSMTHTFGTKLLIGLMIWSAHHLS